MATTDESGRPPSLADARLSLGAAKLDDLFPSEADFWRSLQTYFVLLALAGFVAAFGLYEDSVAAIIGAMVVAPMGGAIMALAGALVTGRSRWQTVSLLQVALGSVMVIGIGWLVSLVAPDPLVLTPALEARTAPGIWDIGVALAAGAAGAYVAARRTGSDALPGVAIAVSLVPPLATVGICLELGRYPDALGALLLFGTNFAAILVVACIVFILSGYAPSATELRERHRLRNGFAAAVVALVMVATPLVLHGINEIDATIRSTVGAPVVREWIGARDLRVTTWEIEGEHVVLEMAGPDTPAPASDLATALAAAFGKPVDLEIHYTRIDLDRATAAP